MQFQRRLESIVSWVLVKRCSFLQLRIYAYGSKTSEATQLRKLDRTNENHGQLNPLNLNKRPKAPLVSGSQPDVISRRFIMVLRGKGLTKMISKQIVAHKETVGA